MSLILHPPPDRCYLKPKGETSAEYKFSSGETNSDPHCRIHCSLGGAMGCNASKVSPHPVDGEPPEMTRQRKAILKAKGRWIAKHLLFPALAAAAKPEPGWQLPKLTKKQQTEWKKKKERIAKQIAEPNTEWDQLGCSVLKLALADTKLVDAAWLAALADAGGVLPRCQDLPAEAIVTYEEMAK